MAEDVAGESKTNQSFVSPGWSLFLAADTASRIANKTEAAKNRGGSPTACDIKFSFLN